MSEPWYNFNTIANIGTPDPFDNILKPDVNYQVPANYPITMIGSGTVTAIDTTSDYGCATTIRLDNPLNPLASHIAFLHLSGFSHGLQVGTHLNPGDLVGYNGGAAACGTQKVPLGVAFYSGDQYGHGSAWTILQSNLLGLLNPVPLIQQLISGTTPGTSSSPFDLGASFQKAFSPILNLFSGAQGIASWLDPLRVLKMVLGLLCLLVAFLMLLAPVVEPVINATAKPAIQAAQRSALA
jgi:hypothetical protein